MRKLIAAAAATALVAVGALGSPGAHAEDDTAPPPPPATEAPTSTPSSPPVLPDGPTTPAPTVALTTAKRVLAGRALPRDPEPTVALRDLWVARPRLDGAARTEADTLLARPTDGARDPQGFGYTARSVATCSARICVHSVARRTNRDFTEPTLAARTLEVMDAAWAAEIDGLGYRPPLKDGTRGGSPRFDVYLADLGAHKLYGYCAAEAAGPGRTATSFCVLDNDFATAQYPSGTPDGNLRVTAAHEFFHAVQYAYDYAEDPWLMESTATWMEERLAGDVNDNRQYLPYGQLYTPYRPLDTFVSTGFQHYGNWIFWEYLSSRYGTSIVSRVWRQAGSLRSDGGTYSFKALRRVLDGKGGLTNVYTRFAGGNLVPELTYPEGTDYPSPRPRRRAVLTRPDPQAQHVTRLAHMSSATLRYVPGADLSGTTWRLALALDGPQRRTSPSAIVTIHRRDGRVRQDLVRLDRRGDRRLKVPFDAQVVAAVSVTVVNASTRMRCDRRTTLACAGQPVDEQLPFAVSAKALRVS